MKLRIIGIVLCLLYCFLTITFLHLSLPLQMENILDGLNGTLWLFSNCLISASLFYLIKRKFNLLSDNLNSITRDFLIFVGSIPCVTFVIIVWVKFVVEKLIFGKNNPLISVVSEYLGELITQSMICISCVSYFYLSALIKTKERLAEAQKAQSEMRLKLLQHQVDPHFLFNNLNVLSSLIESNPLAARAYLAKLAELYRYLLHTQNAEIVSLEDELEFAENYLYLLKERFGAAYRFDWQVPKDKINGQMIVPASVQSLIENIVKHNAGSETNPLPVSIKLCENSLTVENVVSAKMRTQKALTVSGTGLKNLAARFAFLTDQPVEIRREENLFVVTLPLLEVKK